MQKQCLLFSSTQKALMGRRMHLGYKTKEGKKELLEGQPTKEIKWKDHIFIFADQPYFTLFLKFFTQLHFNVIQFYIVEWKMQHITLQTYFDFFKLHSENIHHTCSLL